MEHNDWAAARENVTMEMHSVSVLASTCLTKDFVHLDISQEVMPWLTRPVKDLDNPPSNVQADPSHCGCTGRVVLHELWLILHNTSGNSLKSYLPLFCIFFFFFISETSCNSLLHLFYPKF